MLFKLSSFRALGIRYLLACPVNEQQVVGYKKLKDTHLKDSLLKIELKLIYSWNCGEILI